MDYIKRLITVAVMLAIFLGIPYYWGEGWLWASWFPALIVGAFLED